MPWQNPLVKLDSWITSQTDLELGCLWQNDEVQVFVVIVGFETLVDARTSHVLPEMPGSFVHLAPNMGGDEIYCNRVVGTRNNLERNRDHLKVGYAQDERSLRYPRTGMLGEQSYQKQV